ncbi:hypothetical protein BMD20_03925 [Burkholderia multivorans]|jgi:hypothetical protein|nr:hypothetical protein BMD22_25505 [Burkholderia multivorans]KHS19229.1 hypothetical protein BMD20_03925 [Burkholderia multivorans]
MWNCRCGWGKSVGRASGDRLAHDAVDEFLHRRDVADQADDHAARPGSRIERALLHDFRIDAGDFLGDILERDLRAQPALLVQQAIHCGVAQHTLGVAQWTHHEARAEFGGGDDRLLHPALATPLSPHNAARR